LGEINKEEGKTKNGPGAVLRERKDAGCTTKKVKGERYDSYEKRQTTQKGDQQGAQG